MNDLVIFLIILSVFAIRDGILAIYLIHKLVGSAPSVVAGPQPAPAPVPVPGRALGGAGVPSQPRFTGITATSFAGNDDSVSSRTSAYDEKIINGDTELAAALPSRFTGKPPAIRVFYNGRSADAPIRDVGPWCTSDAYWDHGARPQAETCYQNKSPLPTGPNKGKVPSNPAGLDISPAVWAALGYSGNPRAAKEVVSWDFVDQLAGAAAPPTVAASTDPPWFTWAKGEIGFHETGNNQGIEKYIALSHCGELGDPWCAIFANAALEAVGVPGTRSAAAQSFTTSDKVSRIDTPRIGAIAVFWRNSKSSGLGHVGFYVGEDSSRVQVLGGNENDQVMIEAMPKNGSTMGLIGYWWPASTPKVT